MLGCDFKMFERLKYVRFSHRQFRFQIAPLNCAAREVTFCGVSVKNEILVPTELRHMLHGFNARTHGPIALCVKKILGSFDMGEGPEQLEVFPKKIGPGRRQIQCEKFGKPDRLLFREVLGAFGNSPSAVCRRISCPAALNLTISKP